MSRYRTKAVAVGLMSITLNAHRRRAKIARHQLIAGELGKDAFLQLRRRQDTALAERLHLITVTFGM